MMKGKKQERKEFL